MTFNVPASMVVTWVVFLCTRYFNLLETPLWEIDICRSKITTQSFMPEAEPCSQRMNTVNVILSASFQVVNNFNLPVIMEISDSRISITRNLVMKFSNGSRNIMRVKIASSGSMLKSNNITVFEELNGSIEVKCRFIPTWVNDPFVVCVFIMITCHLLLVWSNGERLYMGMQESSTIPNILQSYLWTKGYLWNPRMLLLGFKILICSYLMDSFQSHFQLNLLGTRSSFANHQDQNDLKPWSESWTLSCRPGLGGQLSKEHEHTSA